MNTKQPEALRIADDLRHSIVYYGRKDAFTLNAYDAEKRLRSLHAENETLRTCNDKAQHEIAALQERVQPLRALDALKKAAAIAVSAVKTNSRDIADWREDMDRIAAIAAQQGEKS